MQGTAGIALAGLINAVRVKGTKLSEERMLFLGAGSAGIGIAGLLTAAMTADGLSEEQARSRISLFDVNGLLEPSRTDLVDFQRPYAHQHAPTHDFVAAIELIRPTAIIGVSTIGRAFSQAVVEAMARINQRPVVFALSNPTDHAECTAEEAYRWSQGRALYAAGVPFPPVAYEGRTILPSQANNLYIFPAVGMAIYATQATRVTDEMFLTAARAVAEQVSPAQLDQGMLYPPQSNILETELYTAARVAGVIFDRGLARVKRPDDLTAFIRAHVYTPDTAAWCKAPPQRPPDTVTSAPTM